jgi:glycosyltransferase involved in cell wall biosynthesis
MLAQEGIEVRFRMAGTGPTLPELQARVRVLGLEDRIEFAGAVPSASEFCRGLDAFVVPSIDAEGLPTTILEAMATGLPIIVTEVGGAVEVVENGRHGLIVPPRDAGALARAIRWLVDHPEDARRLGEAGRQHVRAHFTVERMTRTIVEQVYRPLMGSLG